MTAVQGTGLCCATFGIIALIGLILQRAKLGNLSLAPFVKTGDLKAQGVALAGPTGMVCVDGTVTCDKPLVAPISGTDCLYYKYKVVASWKVPVEGKTETKSHTMAEADKAVMFFNVDDGSGSASVHLDTNADMNLERTVNESKGGKLFGSFAEYKENLTNVFTFGHLSVPLKHVPYDANVKVTEHVLKPNQRMFICGKFGSGGSIGSWGTFGRMIITTKTREELMTHVQLLIKVCLIAGPVLTIGGFMMFYWVWGMLALLVVGAGFGVAIKYPSAINDAVTKIRTRSGDLWAKVTGKGKPAEGLSEDGTVAAPVDTATETGPMVASAASSDAI